MSAPLSSFEVPQLAGLAGPALAPGIRNLLDYAALVPDEQVLLLAEYGTDQRVLELLATAIALRGATPMVLMVPPHSPAGAAPSKPLPAVSAAWAAADLVISLGWWPEVHHAELFFPVIAGFRARYLGLQQVAGGAAFLGGAALAPEIVYAIKRVVLQSFLGCERIRVTTGSGTDLTMTGNRIDAVNGPLGPENRWSPFPYGGLNWSPGSAQGVFVAEESTLAGSASGAPLVLEFDGGRLSAAGAVDQPALRALAGADGYYLRHANIGLNPKARWINAPQLEREKRAGTFYLGIDRQAPGGFAEAGGAHIDCQVGAATVEVDGRVVVDAGRLLALDAPEVRAAAAEYGQPERLLLTNPAIW